MSASSTQLTGRADGTGGHAAPSGFGTASTGKIGMWVFLAADAMGFGGLLLASAVLRTRSGSWPDSGVWTDRALAAVLTFVLLTSGATMSAAGAAARQGRRRLSRVLIALTALAGLAFLAGQAAEYHALVTIRHIGLTTDHAAGTFMLITTYHGLHVLVGVVALAIIACRRQIWRAPGDARPRAGDAHRRVDVTGTLEVASLYWQFVDVVWIVIFTALYLIPPVIRG